jgi:hypothetical protein
MHARTHLQEARPRVLRARRAAANEVSYIVQSRAGNAWQQVPGETCWLLELPEELLLEIAVRLHDHHDLQALALTCRRLLRVVDNPVVWRALAFATFSKHVVLDTAQALGSLALGGGLVEQAAPGLSLVSCLQGSRGDPTLAGSWSTATACGCASSTRLPSITACSSIGKQGAHCALLTLTEHAPTH